MDVDKIIKNFEDHQRKQQEELKRKHEEQWKLIINQAQNIEEFLIDAVLPVFEEVREKIVSAGYPCNIDEKYSKVKKVYDFESEKEYCLELQFNVSFDKNFSGFTGTYLKYLGDFNNETIEVEIKKDSSDRPIKDTPREISCFNKMLIEEKTEELLRAVFSTK